MRTLLLMVILAVCSGTLPAQSVRKLVKTGNKLYEKQQFHEAFEQYNQARIRDPKSYDAYLGMGKCLMKQHQENRAIDEFKRAAAFGIKKWEPHFFLGKIYTATGDWNAAETHLKTAASLARKNKEVKRHLFRAQLHVGQSANALITADELIRREKKNPYYQFLKAVALDSLQQYISAEEFYSRAIQADPNLAEAYVGRAHAKFKMGRIAQALDDCNSAIEINNTLTVAYLMRADLHLHTGDVDAAIHDLTHVLATNPLHVEGRRSRAKAYITKGQAQEAIADWTALINHDPDDFSALHHRAAVFEAIGNYESAVRDYQEMLRIHPGQEQVMTWLNQAQEKRFEQHRESNRPELIIESPRVDELGFIEVEDEASLLSISGYIRDESFIQSITVNNHAVEFAADSHNPQFKHSIPLSGINEIWVKVIDVYANVTEILFPIKITESTPPEVLLLSPFADEKNTIKISPTAKSFQVTGRVYDDSPVNSIVVGEVSALFDSAQLNPRFSAEVQRTDQDQLSITATDYFGNTTAASYEIQYHASTVHADQVMGRTWVVFIENSHYESFAVIDGPERDVTLMKNALKNYQIEHFIHKKNLSKTAMERFFSLELRDLIEANQVNSLLIWYAGHGKFINDTGYWVPVDASRDVEFSFYNINVLKAGLLTYSDHLNHTLVVTDACETGSAFAQIGEHELSERACGQYDALGLKSWQTFSSAGYEQASDQSQFTLTFANMLANNPDVCMPIERIVERVSEVVKKQSNQSPKFGIIPGMGDENGTFFFMKKSP